MIATAPSRGLPDRLPVWFTLGWSALVVPAGSLVLLFVWDRTWGIWGGWRFSPLGLGHSSPGVMLIGFAAYFLLAIWIAGAIGWLIIRRRTVRNWSPRWPWWLVGLTSVVLLLPNSPTAFLEVPFVRIFGPGRNPAEFLYVAAAQNSRALASAVIARGGRINDKTAAGDSPVQRAASGGDPAFVAWLADIGADVNARGRLGYTPLVSAVNNGHVDVVRLLLERGADPKMTTDSGKTALDFALDGGDPRIVEAIRRATRVP